MKHTLSVISFFIIMGAITITATAGAIFIIGTSGLIKECERELPRTQQCMIIAIPEVDYHAKTKD